MKLSITKIVHLLLSDLITDQDILVDATTGLGKDTLFLASKAKHVYAFDIQESAIMHAKHYTKAYSNITYILDSHLHLFNYVQDFKGIVFNLGYLPSGDKQITTKKETTVPLLHLLISSLSSSQFISLTIYPGHTEGFLEHLAIEDLISHLDPKTFEVIKISLPIQDNHPPYTLLITKKI